MAHKAFFKHVISELKITLVSGLFAIFPLSATIFVTNFLYQMLIKWLIPLRTLEPEILQKIPGSELLLMIAMIFVIGLLVKLLIISPLIHYIEHIIDKIPLVGNIYSALKSLTDFFKTANEDDARHQVVLVNFPRKEFFNIAFLIGPAKSYEPFIESAAASQGALYKVFIPTSPLPGHGHFAIVSENDLIKTNLTFEEAMKITVSCGLVGPQPQL